MQLEFRLGRWGSADGSRHLDAIARTWGHATNSSVLSRGPAKRTQNQQQCPCHPRRDILARNYCCFVNIDGTLLYRCRRAAASHTFGSDMSYRQRPKMKIGLTKNSRWVHLSDKKVCQSKANGEPIRCRGASSRRRTKQVYKTVFDASPQNAKHIGDLPFRE